MLLAAAQSHSILKVYDGGALCKGLDAVHNGLHIGLRGMNKSGNSPIKK